MALRNYTLHRRAQMALHQLSEAEQELVLDRLKALLELPVAQWPPAWVKRLKADQALYLVRVNDSLRFILQEGDGKQPELMDIVRHETLESFAKAMVNGGG